MGDNGTMRTFALLLLVLCTACSNHRYFAPRENRNGTGPGGHPAVVYAVGVPSLGEVRLWSPGTAMVDGDEGGDVVALQVGFEIENTGTVPLAIDTGTLRCEDLWVDDQRAEPLSPVRTEGAVEVLPGTSGRLVATFRPPFAARARDVDGFTVRFQVLAAGQPVLAQVTPFVPHIPDDRWRDDPWFWGHSGWGFGFGWSHNRYCYR